MPTAAAEAVSTCAVALRRAQPDDVLVAIDEEQAVVRGFAHVQRDAGLLATPYARLRALVVDEGARNRGIGASLLAAAEHWALQHDLRELRVDSNSVRERAHRFYQRHGYGEHKRQCVFTRRLA